MDYKKLVSLLAVSTLALAACDTEEPAEEPDVEEPDTGDEVDETDETSEDEGDETADSDGEGDSAHDIIDGIEGDDLGYTADVELEIIGGTWTQDGYEFVPSDGEATVEGHIFTDEEIFAYVIQDGAVVEAPAIEEGVFEFTGAPGEAFQVGVSDEELWSEGDDADPEELDRWEDVVISTEEAEEEPAE